MPCKREWLIKARKNKGLSRAQTAKALKIDASYIEKIENGKRRPSVPLAKRFGILLGIDWQCFYTQD